MSRGDARHRTHPDGGGHDGADLAAADHVRPHHLPALAHPPGDAAGEVGARPADPQDHVKWDEVAGLEEARAEMEEIVDFLKHPKRFSKLGARVPKGILL